MSLADRPRVTSDMLKIVNCEILGKLPDPFVFDDGRRMSDPSEWAARRREIYRTAIELQYGTLPPEPEFIKVETLYRSAKNNVFRITSATKARPVSFRLKLVMPEKVEKPPVIVDGDLCFGYSSSKDWMNAALDNGIGLALFDRTELAHDIMYEGRQKGDLYEAYPGCTFGALAAWAWGYSRVVDALEILGLADMSNITFTGHSRGGKTAALAGALDERAAIVNPNGTCAGACSCYRTHLTARYLDAPQEKRSETLDDLYSRFDYWIGPGMAEYVSCEDKLPFDCHFLKAMIAPRTLFLSEAAGDVWSNPVGAWQTSIAAAEVYKFLGAGDELFWYFRPGKHFHDVEDIEMLVSLIKRRRDGEKDFDRSRFFGLPFDPSGLEPIFDWRAPEK